MPKDKTIEEMGWAIPPKVAALPIACSAVSLRGPRHIATTWLLSAAPAARPPHNATCLRGRPCDFPSVLVPSGKLRSAHNRATFGSACAHLRPLGVRRALGNKYTVSTHSRLRSPPPMAPTSFYGALWSASMCLNYTTL